MKLTSAAQHKLLLGMRLDHHPEHAFISSPRAGIKSTLMHRPCFVLILVRVSVSEYIHEDHAALTGARDLVIEEQLAPEQSYNFTVNFYKKIYTSSGWILGLETAAWHTYFSNQILPDFDSNPNEIRYANLDGNAVSQGFSANLEAILGPFRAYIGASLLDVFTKENNQKQRPVFTEKWSATWAITLPLFNENIRLIIRVTSMDPCVTPLE